MKSSEIRRKFLDFLVSRGHKVIEPAPLVLSDDPTTLFTGSGMQPLLPYLLGQEHPAGVRLTDVQPCIRVQDIEDVGDNRHTTCFEMMGNWSLGDYFKEEQINNFLDFLVKEVGLDVRKIFVTCFIGDTSVGISRDTEAAEIWVKAFARYGVEAGIAEIGSASDGDKRGIKDGERIFFYDDKENWWSRGGGIATTPVGDPCGPDSEVFYDFGEEAILPEYRSQGVLSHPAGENGQFVEIGNQVFMQYKRTDDGFEELAKKNIDFGGGLSRIAMASLGVPDVFQTDLYYPIIEKLEELSGKKYESNAAEMRIIADHLTSAVFLASGGLTPSNKEQGYVLRRFLRRAILRALRLGIEGNFISEIVPIVASIYGDFYLSIGDAVVFFTTALEKEEKAFRQTIRQGLREFNKLAENEPEITGEMIFRLQDTYGFPMELTIEEAFHWSKPVSDGWRAEFDRCMKEQRELSRTATKGRFKGGLESQSDMNVRYHTTAHLLMAALRKVLGAGVLQKGCNIDAERIRLDFSCEEKMTAEQIAEVVSLVNSAILADLPVSYDEVDTDFALGEMGAMGAFRERYGEKVKVYTVGTDGGKIAKGWDSAVISREVCGGPHVSQTGKIAGAEGLKFEIVKETSSSAGVRRIKAVLR
ncbi:MAG: alanine--tRNA ligase [Candidatus Nomurabacteria bacterium]|jgi:alanyl-tRNA synthetase|nr:alanine--tRNA ligase [Candidatus Nomurabacteria bacterium]